MIRSRFHLLAAFSLATASHATTAPLVPLTTLWQNNFESNSAGQSTGASPAAINGFRFNFPGGIVRDSSVTAPFGSPNLYLELSPENNVADPASGYRVIVNSVLKSDYTTQPVGISFDFNESTAPGFETVIGFGTGAFDSSPDVNNASGLISLRFRNGAITLGDRTSLVSVGANDGSDPETPMTLPSFIEGTTYRLTFISNFTAGSHEILGPDNGVFTLAPMQGAFFLYDPATEAFAPRVIIANNNSRVLEDHVSFLFRHFSPSAESERQTIYVDNMVATNYGEPPAVWTGAGADALWSNAANWRDEQLPQAGKPVIFSGGDNLDPLNDFPADTTFDEISFIEALDTFRLDGNRVGVSWRISNDSPATQILATPILIGSPVLLAENLAGGTTLALEGTISGTGSLLKKGQGALELSGDNDFTGSKTVDQGAVVVINDQSAATGSWHLRGHGAIGSTPASAATNVGFTTDATIAVAAGNSIQIGHNAGVGGFQAQSLTSSAAVTNDGSLYVGRSGTLTVNDGTWTQRGVTTVATQGGGLAALNVVNGGTFDYSASQPLVLQTSLSNGTRTRLTIDGGILITNQPVHNPTTDLSPEDSAFADVILGNGGVLRLGGHVEDLLTTAGGNVRFLLESDGGTIDTNGFDATLKVAVAGSGGLTKSGAGTFTTTAANSYEGDTTVTGGTLRLSSPDLADDSSVSVATGAVLMLDFVGDDTIAALTLGGSELPEGTYDATTHPDYLAGGGRLVIASDVTPGDSFAAWAAELGLAGDPGADYDGDGLADAVEFVLGSDPKTPDGNLIASSEDADHLTVVFTRSERAKTADITLSVEAGETLAAWPQSYLVAQDTATSSPGVTVAANGDGSDTVSVTIPKNGAAALFARVKVQVVDNQ